MKHNRRIGLHLPLGQMSAMAVLRQVFCLGGEFPVTRLFTWLDRLSMTARQTDIPCQY